MIEKDFCLKCYSLQDIETVTQVEEIKIHEENFHIESVFGRCLKCGEEFTEVGKHNFPVAEAYEQYQKKRDFKQ